VTDATDTLLDAWDTAIASWPDRPSFQAAIAAASTAFGYAANDVDAQLHHVIARCRASVLRTLLEREVPAAVHRPTRVLVLTSGGVPGLVLESIASVLALGAVAVVRPSRDEHVLDQLYPELPVELSARIEIVSGDDVPWDDVDAAIIHGSDETIAMVRGRLTPLAAQRVAAYGSRQGISLVTRAGIDATPEYADLLADDVLVFRQRGCMSPSWLFVVEDGDGDLMERVIGDVGRALALARPRHLAPGTDDAVAQRRASDADVLGAIAAGLAPDPRLLHAGDARLTIVGLDSADSIFLNIAPLGSLLQTATLVTAPAERAAIEATLHRCGCTRIVAAGRAHRPDPLWPQDGIGRLAPLVGQ
jgi:hypothetical protein